MNIKLPSIALKFLVLKNPGKEDQKQVLIVEDKQDI
ncbi:MAG: hypothetical protein CM1200mP30_23480 [Pseudomonadota bacterium]|nr:MAG: hypothetical protein CM1200mP30_23480 [Pseudomonadota bacterium]